MIKTFMDTNICKNTVTHHFHLAVCHGWLNLPLGGCRGYDGGDFCCGAEAGLLHLTVKVEKYGLPFLMMSQFRISTFIEKHLDFNFRHVQCAGVFSDLCFYK